MLRIIKFSCPFIVMLISFVLPSAYQLGQGHIPDGLQWLFRLFWSPASLISIGGIVIGGLFFAYGKNAFCPWLGLITDAGINDKLDVAKAVAILNTAQKLVITSGLIVCGISILMTLGDLDQSSEEIVWHVALTLVSLIQAGLISLLFILPVRAYWEGESLSDNA